MKVINNILVFLFFSTVCSGQQYPTLHYSFEDGLPSNTIYQIYRDSKGFLWIGTDKGIARYDGVKFEVFTSNNGLPDNEIYFFREDHYGRLWIATSNGKLCFYKNDTFYTESNAPYLKLPFELPHIKIISIEYDSSVTISTYDPTLLVNFKKNNKYILYIDREISAELRNDMFYKRKIAPDKYMIYSRDCKYILDTFHKASIITKLSFDTSLRINFDQDQEYIFNRQYLYTDEMKIIRKIKNNLHNKTRIYTYYFDGINFFTCTRDGLFLNDSIPIIENADVSSITQDYHGNYWVSTLNNGVYCLRYDFLKMNYYPALYSGKIFYSKIVKGDIFYATHDNDLWKINNGSAQCVFNYRQYINRAYPHPNDAAYFLDDDFKYHSFYNDDYIFISDVRLPRIKFQIQRYKHNLNNSGPKKLIHSNSEIYLRLVNCIVKVNTHGIKSGEFLKEEPLTDRGFTKTYGISTDATGHLWYSNIANIFLIDSNFRSIPQLQLKNISFKNFDFIGPYILVNTFTNHLLLIRDFIKSPKIDTIKSDNCIWNNIYKLNDTSVLLSTNNYDRLLVTHTCGAQRYSLSVIEDPFIPLNIDGFCSNDSICCFFKTGDITILPLNSLYKRSNPPILFFDAIRSNRITSRINKSDFTLSYRDAKNVAISFRSLSFGSNKLIFEYSFSKGPQNIWRTLKSEEINIVNPGYGDFIIKVRAKTIDSDFSKPIILELHVLRPYWAQWWFIGLLILIIVVLVLSAIKLRLSYIMKKNQKEHDIELKFIKSEYKAINALMNPHFIFNTLNNVQSLFNENDKLAANKYLRIFADLIRQNMYNVSKEVISLQKEIALVENYMVLEKLRFDDKLNYYIDIDDNIDMTVFMVPPLLIQPLVENSIKHGILPMKERGGTVIVSISEEADFLQIQVKDNGIGLTRSSNNKGIMHESFGMDSIKKRIEQLSIIRGKEITFDINEIVGNGDSEIWTVVTLKMTI